MRHRIPLEIAIARIHDCLATRAASRWSLVRDRLLGAEPLHCSLTRLGDDARRLFPKRLCQPLVPAAHLVMGCMALRLTCLVGDDLRRRGTPTALLLEPRLDLLAARTGGLEIVRRVAANLGLAARPALD